MTPELINKITNYCALILVVCGTFLGAHVSGQLILPPIILTIMTVLSLAATAITGWFTGKSTIAKTNGK